jgi:hypothetical protein
MAMSRKHYSAIAERFVDASTYVEDNYGETLTRNEVADVLNYLAGKIAGVMEDDNPNFDRKKFLTACGEFIQNR